MAGSTALREEFRIVRRNSQRLEQRLTVDQLLAWLSAMARLLPTPKEPRRFIEYKNVRF